GRAGRDGAAGEGVLHGRVPLVRQRPPRPPEGTQAFPAPRPVGRPVGTRPVRGAGNCALSPTRPAADQEPQPGRRKNRRGAGTRRFRRPGGTFLRPRGAPTRPRGTPPRGARPRPARPS